MPILLSSSITTRFIRATALPPVITLTIFSPLSSHSLIIRPPLDNTQTPHNAISDFLLSECWLSSSEIAKLMRRQPALLRTRSSHTAREAVQLLRELGLTQNQLKNTILRNPTLLSLKSDTQLKVKIEFMKTLGLTATDVACIVFREPRLLNFSLDKTLIPRIPYLEHLFGSKSNLCKALKRASGLLVIDVEKQLKPKLDLLKQYGIEGEFLSLLLSRTPGILTRISTKLLKLRIEYVKNMGILECSKRFVNTLCLVIGIAPEKIEEKVKHMACLGLPEDDIQQLLKKYPRVFFLSTNKMEKNLDFLTQTTGLPIETVLKHPSLLTYSIEKRLNPRYQLFKFLSPMEHTKHLPTLVTMFKLGEKIFVEKFVRCNPQILYEIQREKSADLTIPRISLHVVEV